MKEIWKSFIPGTDEYEVSNLGHFRRTIKGKTHPLKITLSRSGVPRVRVYNTHVDAANTVARTFLPDPAYDDTGTAVPKDCNPANLMADNLEWISGRINVFTYCMDESMRRIVSEEV